MKKNDIVTLKITSVTADGKGVGKTDDGMVVFVPLTAVGDVAEVRILKVLKNSSFGKIENLITESQSRITPDCNCFSKCGGCVFRHISYCEELKIKEQRVADAITRVGGLNDVEIKSIIGSSKTDGYRNKAQLPIGKNNYGEIITGFFANHSHRIIECDSCLLQPDIFNKITDTVKEFIKATNTSVYNEQTHTGVLRHIYIRYGEKTGEIMVCIVINAKRLEKSELLVEMLKKCSDNIKTVILNINREKTNVVLGKENKILFGDGYINDILCNLKIRINPLSFYQVNRQQAEVLYNKAFEYADLSGNETVVDLYCGTGTIGLSVSHKAKKLIGVEIVKQAVEDAKINAKINGIENAEFICGDASKAVEILKERNIKPDVIIIDPPRKGSTPQVINYIAQVQPKKVVYVSCDPATLARDLKLFDELGYKTLEVTPVDMFPRTSHVETVALLSRKINLHKMKLNSAPFTMIKSGEKTIELRLYDEKRQKIKVGDKILFTDNTTGETLNTTIVKLHRFDTFDELYKSLPLLKCGYVTESIDKATPADMEQYYPVEEQKKYGVVGIELYRHKQFTD